MTFLCPPPVVLFLVLTLKIFNFLTAGNLKRSWKVETGIFVKGNLRPVLAPWLWPEMRFGDFFLQNWARLNQNPKLAWHWKISLYTTFIIWMRSCCLNSCRMLHQARLIHLMSQICFSSCSSFYLCYLHANVRLEWRAEGDRVNKCKEFFLENTVP